MANRIFGQRDIHRQNRQRLRAGHLPPEIPPYWRPTRRSECVNGPRPCPYVACKHNLFLDITPRGGLRVPYGEDPDALYRMADTCALDVADRGGVTLEAVARLQAITRERVRQIELMALRRLEAALQHILDDEDLPPRRTPGPLRPPPPPRPAPTLSGRVVPRSDLRDFLADG